MRLTDLNAKLAGTLADGILRFDCPMSGHTHKIRVFVHREAPGPKVPSDAICACGEPHKYWQASGEFPETLTLLPSVDANTPETPCWHGHIENGAIK